MKIHVLIDMQGDYQFHNVLCFSTPEKLKEYLENHCGEVGKAYAKAFFFGADNEASDEAWEEYDEKSKEEIMGFEYRVVDLDEMYLPGEMHIA